MAWNDTCASDQTVAFFGYAHSYGIHGFCNSASAEPDYIGTGGGEGGPSGCATGVPATKGVVSGSCAGWAKPGYQAGVFGMSSDGVRDVPDVSMFASDGWEWQHQYLICFSDPNNGGAACRGNPASWGLGGGGTSDSGYEPAFETHPGYDFPSGIGTIDAGNLVDDWIGGIPDVPR